MSTIKQVLTNTGWQIEVDSLKRFQSVTISFVNCDGKDDETEFDIKGACTKAGIKELDDLFIEFCRENKFPVNTVNAVIVTKSAYTMKELMEE